MQIPLSDTPTPKILKSQSDRFEGLDMTKVFACMDFMRVAKGAMTAFYGHFHAFDISPGKYSVLMELLALDGETGLPPSELAARIGVSRATVTGLVDGLKRQGFISRVEDERDRRSLKICLTKAGREFMDELLPVQFHRMALMMSKLDENGLAQLKSGCALVEKGVDALMTDLRETKKGMEDAG